MIVHIVMWRLKDQADKIETAAKIKETLEGLNGKISTIKKLEVGFNYNISPAAYDVALYSEFDSKEGLEIYQKHPDHVKAAEFVGSVVSERVVVDYEK